MSSILKKSQILSVVIPAYNNPAYLKKCLSSISKQNYKYLEIIIADDCSPLSLNETVESAKKMFHDKIKIKFFRQEKNLGVYWNLIFALKKCTGPYVTFMQHDDWFIDNNFYKESIEKLNENDDLKVVIANSEQEFSKQKSMKLSQLERIEMDGSKYVCEHLFYDLHPIFSTVIYKKDAFIDNEYDKYFVSKENADYMEVEIDECFVALILAASSGKVLISGKVVCIQGKPKTAATNLNLHLLKKKGMDVGMFIPYYKLYKHFSTIDNLNCIKEMKRLIIKKFCVRHINLRVLKYFHWEFEAIQLMFISFTYRCFRKLKKISCERVTSKFLKRSISVRFPQSTL